MAALGKAIIPFFLNFFADGGSLQSNNYFFFEISLPTVALGKFSVKDRVSVTVQFTLPTAVAGSRQTLCREGVRWLSAKACLPEGRSP